MQWLNGHRSLHHYRRINLELTSLPNQDMKMVFVVLLVSCVLAVTQVQAERLSSYVAPTGVHCIPCPAGKFVQKHCTEDLTNSTCKTCPNLHYSDKPNSKTYCTECRPLCPKSGHETQHCTASKNRECRCKDGYHKYPLDEVDPRWTCQRHTSCGQGEGEVYYGNHTHNTECKGCNENEQFRNETDPNHPVCQDCTTCPPGVHVVTQCTLNSNRVCGDSGNVTNIVGSSTEPPVTTTTDIDQSSGTLSEAIIFCIVYGVLVVLGFVADITLYLWTKTKSSKTHLKGREIFALILAAVVGFGLIAAVVVLILARRRGSRRGMVNGQAKYAKDSGDGFTEPFLNWSSKFIQGEVFLCLSRYLGAEWQEFIRQLPGWQANRAVTVIEHKQEEEKTVQSQIIGCLITWQREFPDHVTKKNICDTLKRVCRKDVIQKLEKLHAEHPDSPGINRQ